MAVLVLNAGTASPITLLVQTAGETAPTEIGSVTQSFNGADRSTVRGTKRNFGAMTTFVDTATKESIVSILKNGAQLPCSGDLLANIQTQCTIRYTGARMIPGLPGYWEIGLTGNEVQGSVVLLKYAAGDTITGEAFTRASTGYYINASGVLVAVGNNVKRDSHYIGGVRSILLEDTRTNEILWANDFSNAAWVKTSVTVATGIADPAAGTNACTLTATGATANVTQTLAAGASVARTNSIWMRRRTGVGVIALSDPLNGANSTPTLTGTWQRFNIAAAAGTARVLKITIFTSGDAIDVYNGQMEPGAFVSSEIVTTTVAVTRAADSYSLPFTTPPQESTIYARFVEGGTISTTNARLWAISAGATSPEFIVFVSGGLYYTDHINSGPTEVSTPGISPVIGNVEELVSRLFGDGSVDSTQSINSATATSAAQTVANPLATAWAGQLVWLNSAGASGFAGFTAIQSFKICAGARSLSEMRAL